MLFLCFLWFACLFLGFISSSLVHPYLLGGLKDFLLFCIPFSVPVHLMIKKSIGFNWMHISKWKHKTVSATFNWKIPILDAPLNFTILVWPTCRCTCYFLLKKISSKLLVAPSTLVCITFGSEDMHNFYNHRTTVFFSWGKGGGRGEGGFPPSSCHWSNPVRAYLFLRSPIKKGRTQCRRLLALCRVWGRVVSEFIY